MWSIWCPPEYPPNNHTAGGLSALVFVRIHNDVTNKGGL
jgi:hypothetical protein